MLFRSHARFLPASKINSAQIQRAIISDGCVITQANVERAVIGIRSFIEAGSSVKNCVMMGADYFDSDLARPAGAPALGIGRNCVIDSAIIDKNARIGDNVVIQGDPNRPDSNHQGWYVRDGIVCVAKGATIPSGSVMCTLRQANC